MLDFNQDPYTLTFEINELPKSLNQMLRGHWTIKAGDAKSWKNKVNKAVPLPFRPKKPLEKVSLTLTRVSSVEPDYDNLVSSFKHVIDGLKEIGIIADDKNTVVVARQYAHEKCSPKEGKIRVRVESVSV